MPRKIRIDIKVETLEKKRLGVPTGTIRNPETGRKIDKRTRLKTLIEKNKKTK
jgi:hypothetical protein